MEAHELDAEPPRVWIRPANAGEPPIIFVGNETKIMVTDKRRALQWARILADYALSS